MTPREYSTAKHLWKLIQAHAAMEQAIASLNYILESEITSGPLYNALLTAVYTLYAKPFGNNNQVGVLTPKVIPTGAEELHEQILAFRNYLFAHSDSRNLKTEKYGPIVQARFTFRDGEDPRIHTSSIAFPREKLLLFAKYIHTVYKTIGDMVFDELKGFELHFPKASGEYALNVYDKKGSVFITQEEAKAFLSADAMLVSILLPPSPPPRAAT